MKSTMNDRSTVQRDGVSAREVGTRFSLHPETVRRWARAGRIPCFRAGRAWRFDLNEVEEALRPEQSPAA